MAQWYESITPMLDEFIRDQHMFFVASAPLDPTGHVNLSPKGLDCFRILSPTSVAYLDLTGSGNETSAHMEENGRITLMFCSFAGSPRILRLYGHGRVVLPSGAEWAELAALFPALPGARQIVVATLSGVQTSCGFAVPLMDFVGQRDTLIRWAETKGDDGVAAYQREKNTTSLDGLPTTLAGQVEQSV